MFISITFRATSINEANKTQRKVRGSKLMFKMSTINANTCIRTTTSLRNRCCCDDCVVQLLQQPPLLQHTFLQLLHIMDPRTVDPLLKDTPDAVVHRIQIWRIGWHCTFIPRWDPSEVCWRRCTSATPVCCHVDTGRAANATRHTWRHVPGMPCRCLSGPFHRCCCSAGNWRRHCFVRPTPEDCATAVTNNNFVQCPCNSTVTVSL